MFNLHSKDVVMKKLLIVALLAASVMGIAEARCGSNGCCPKRECAPKCAPKSCLRGPCIVGTESSCCEGPQDQLCALEPARVDLIKHVNTSINYTCAGLTGCQVKPTQAQVDQLIQNGDVPADTQPCP